MSKNIQRCLLCIGALLLLAAGGLFGWYRWEDRLAQKNSEALLRQMQDQIDPVLAKPVAMAEADAVPDIPMPEDALGIISVGGLTLPVLNLYSEELLKQYPCRYGQEQCGEGQIVIAGHNYKSHFALLHKLSPGDCLLLTLLDGTVRSYVLTETDVISGNDTDALFAGEWDLTLFTCTADSVNRVIARFALGDCTAE